MASAFLCVTCLLIGDASANAAEPLPRLKAQPNEQRGGRIVDDAGREVLLRGVNVNSLGQYWKGTRKSPVLAFDRRDPARIAEMGWNTVRLIVSWSRVEPRPGIYNEKYLNLVGRWVDRLEKQGIYTIIDFHQDAWGATLAARPGETCTPPAEPGFGWDGAPGWATLSEGKPRCFTSAREVNPAVITAWTNFFNNSPAADGVGIQTRYVGSLRRVARRFARDPAVAGIDIMNEPGALGQAQNAALRPFYSRAVRAIRTGERQGRGFSHMILFEPSVLWPLTGSGAPPVFTTDRNIVYSPHLYGGSIGGDGPPSRASFVNALAEAGTFGGAPVLTGEWGGSPERATGLDNDYFNVHQALQDEFRIGATMWTWKQSCGDPHAASHDGSVPSLPPWSLYRMNCVNGANQIVGQYPMLRKDLRRGYVRRAPGRLVSTSWKQAGRILKASGTGNPRGSGPLEVFFPQLSNIRVRVNHSARGGYVTSRVVGSGRAKGVILSVPLSPGKWTVLIRNVTGKR